MNGNSLFELVVMQTLQVTLLAGIVLALTKFFTKDRPHLAHALWALVLLKCLLPPIIASPTSVFSWLSNGFAAVSYGAQQSPTEIEQSLNTARQAEGLAPVIVRVLPDSITNDGVEAQAELPSKNSVAARFSGISLVESALYVWVAIAACVFLVSALRLWVFMRRVRKTTLPTSPSLNALVKSVSKRIGLRRSVQIRTVDTHIGPAVVGLIWPTILLPKVIVEGKADSELEPLLAHELIHIRRGDLVWAMLQGMSVSLWWFNPFVWIAERLLTREAERSCDEETIAGLGCSPAVYARSLLDVMERKHQLRAAPSLPGVRPIDITAKRLERIMRLGQGCYRQRPWWVVVVWLFGCAMVLPGAAWLVAQEKPKQQESVFKKAGFSSETYPQPLSLSRAQVVTPDVAQTRIVAKSFQVDDVVERLCKERTLTKVEAEKELIQLIRPNDFVDLTLEDCIAIANGNSKASRTSTASGDVFPDTKPSLKVEGGQLRACATADELKQIESSLDHYRKFGFKSVLTEFEFYEIPRRLAFEEAAAETGKLAFKNLGNVTSDLGLNGNLTLSADAAAFDGTEIAKFKQWLEQDNKDLIRVSSPRITSFSGQSATVQLGMTHDFTVAYQTVKAADGKSNYEPVIQKMQTGMHCETRAIVMEPNKEGAKQQIELKINCKQSELIVVDKFKQKFPGSDQEFTIEIPVIRNRFFETGFQINLDQTLVVVQTLEEKTLITMVHCQPMDANVAPVPPAALNKLNAAAYVSVSDELQSDLECALVKYKLQQLGIKDFRIDDGRIQVSVEDDWKAALTACQELRSKRYLTSPSTTQAKPSDNQKFRDGDIAYYPVQIYGPVIQRQTIREIPILSNLPFIGGTFRQTAIAVEVQEDVPSSDEILQALKKRQSDKGLAPEVLDANQIKITTTKIKEFSDPSRFIPLIGDAVLHHAHFKCLLHDSSSQELKAVAFIDYCHFEMANADAN